MRYIHQKQITQQPAPPMLTHATKCSVTVGPVPGATPRGRSRTPDSPLLLPKTHAAGSAGADRGLQLRAPHEELRDIVIRHRGLIGRFLKTLFDHLQGIAQMGTTEA